jgi:hypothetical protein
MTAEAAPEPDYLQIAHDLRAFEPDVFMLYRNSISGSFELTAKTADFPLAPSILVARSSLGYVEARQSLLFAVVYKCAVKAGFGVALRSDDDGEMCLVRVGHSTDTGSFEVEAPFLEFGVALAVAFIAARKHQRVIPALSDVKGKA